MNPEKDSTLYYLYRVILARIPFLFAVLVAFIVCVELGINLLVPFLFAISLWLILYGISVKTDINVLETNLGNKLEPKQYKRNQWVAVCGKAEALIASSNVNSKTILAYYYRVFDFERRLRNPSGGHMSKYSIRRFDGFYLTPMGISTSFGRVRLIGFPDLLHLEKSPFPDGVLSRGEAIAQLNHRFIPSFIARAFVIARVRNQLDVVIKYGTQERSSEGSAEFRSLIHGDQICVFGRWNDGELLPDLNRHRGLPVYAGTPEDVLEELKGDSNTFFIIGIVLSTITTGLVIYSLIWV